MSSGNGRLTADPLFQGLTRPSMVLGVSYPFFTVNAALCMVFFIQTSNFLVLILLAPFIHAAAFLICSKEPRAMELLMLRMSKGTKCLNRAYHGQTNSYDVF